MEGFCTVKLAIIELLPLSGIIIKTAVHFYPAKMRGQDVKGEGGGEDALASVPHEKDE